MRFRRRSTIFLLALLMSVTARAEIVAEAYAAGVQSLHLGRYAEARQSFEAALIAAERHGAPADRGLILDRLGDALAGEGEWLRAERSYRRSLQAWSAAPEPRPLDALLPLADLANVVRHLGRLSETAELQERGYQSAVALVGEDHAEIAILLNQRAQLAQQAEDYGSARDDYARAVEIWRRIGRDGEADAAYPLHNLGLLEVRRGAPREGRAMLERAHAIWQRTLPQHHPIFAGSLAALGEASAALGQAAEACALFEAALGHARASLGPDHVKVGLLLARYSAAVRSLGRKKEARRLAAESGQILGAHDGARQAANTVDIGALGRGLH